MRKNKTYELLTLIYRCFFVFFCISFAASFLGAILVFLKLGYLEFSWMEIIFISLKKGAVIGLVLGIGLWIKARIQEYKDGKNSTE